MGFKKMGPFQPNERMQVGAWGSLSEERLQNEAVPLACPQTRTIRAEDRHKRWPAPKACLFWGYPRPNFNGLVPCSRRLINKALFGERPPCPLISEDPLHLAEMLQNRKKLHDSLGHNCVNLSLKNRSNCVKERDLPKGYEWRSIHKIKRRVQ